MPKPTSAIEPAATPAPTAIANSTKCQAFPPQASSFARRTRRARSHGIERWERRNERQLSAAASTGRGWIRLRCSATGRCRWTTHVDQFEQRPTPAPSGSRAPSFPRAGTRRAPPPVAHPKWWETRFCARSRDPGEVADAEFVRVAECQGDGQSRGIGQRPQRAGEPPCGGLVEPAAAQFLGEGQMRHRRSQRSSRTRSF